MRNLIAIAFFVCSAGMTPGRFMLAEEVPPFVAGYDRFYGKSNAGDAMAGELLLTELSCTACHRADESLAPKNGPELGGLGDRLQPAWIRSYLATPSLVKPGGLMPHLLHQISDDERPDAVEALIAFLSSTATIEPTIVASGGNPVAHEFWLKGDIERGRMLYHQVGCIACHAIDNDFQPHIKSQSDIERKIESLGLEPDELEAMGLVLPKPVQPVPMSEITEKFTLRSLSMFLIAPHLVRPSGRMPSLKLQPHEAADIASFLFRHSSKTASQNRIAQNIQPAGGEVSRELDVVLKGQAIFERLACANCHAHPTIKPRPAKPLIKLDVSGLPKGCLAEAAEGPKYGLSDDQIEALASSIIRFQSQPSRTKGDELSFTILQLNCYACHERDGRGGVGPMQWPYFENVQQVDIGDEGRMPPPLDHLGQKLKKDWIQKVLEGKGDVRPHFRVRMPVFSSHAKSLSAAFVAVDQAQQMQARPPLEIANLPAADLEAGRELLDSGCIQCHALRGESLPGTIGIDLADVSQRIQPEWFHAFLLNPASLKKNTRMPSFFPDGKSSNPHLLDGDIPRQIASIWGYLNAKDQPLPIKLEQSRSKYFELQPVDRPLLQRTFMEPKSAGTHAIAVGFPEQYHFAFDAKGMRLAEIWKGRFLNAQGTWFDRFAPPAIPLGTHRILLPSEHLVEKHNDGTLESIASSEKFFRGYRLDNKGIPSFSYTIGAINIEDRIEAQRDSGFLRRLSIKPVTRSTSAISRPVWMVLASDAIESDSQRVCTTHSRLRIEVSESTESQVRKHGELSDFMIAIPNRPVEIEVRYQW